MKKYLIFFIILYLSFVSPIEATAIKTTGFIPGQIWYSKDNITEGDTVKIYTAIWNNSTLPLSAKVEFFDQNVILGTRDIVVPSLQLKETSVSWEVTSGDHLISAKIISPNVTISGKKEIAIVSNVLTSTDRKFIPKVLNTIEGIPASSSDVLNSQLDKATASLNSIIPVSISSPISSNIGTVDSFRMNTLKSISETKAEAEKKISDLNNQLTNEKSTIVDGKVLSTKIVVPQSKGIDNATEKPIAYIKLFLFSVLSFVFGSKIVFYILIILVLFFTIRGIYRKIKNK